MRHCCFSQKPKGVSGEVTYSLLQSDWMNAWRKSADEPIRKQQLFALSNTTELHLAFGDLLERMDFEKIYDQLQQLSVIATTSESGTVGERAPVFQSHLYDLDIQECIFTIGIHVFSPYFIYETAFAPDPALNGPYTFRVVSRHCFRRLFVAQNFYSDRQDCPRPGAYVGVVGDDWQRLLEEIVYTINGSSADSFRMNSTSSELFLADDLDRLVEKGSQHVLGVLAHWPEETDATSTINVTVGHCGKAPDADDGVAEHETLTPTETADVVWIPIPTDAEMAPMPTPAEEDALPFTIAAEPTTPETPIETTMPHLDAPVTDRPIHIARLRTVLITAKCPSRGDVIETLPRRFRVDQEEGYVMQTVYAGYVNFPTCVLSLEIQSRVLPRKRQQWYRSHARRHTSRSALPNPRQYYEFLRMRHISLSHQNSRGSMRLFRQCYQPSRILTARIRECLGSSQPHRHRRISYAYPFARPVGSPVVNTTVHALTSPSTYNTPRHFTAFHQKGIGQRISGALFYLSCLLLHFLPVIATLCSSDAPAGTGS